MMEVIPISTTANRATSPLAVRGNVASGCDLLPPDFAENYGKPHYSPKNHRHNLFGLLGVVACAAVGAVLGSLRS